MSFSDIPLPLHSDALFFWFGLACHEKMNSGALEMDEIETEERGTTSSIVNTLSSKNEEE